MRTLVFVSHANPEDNQLAEWLCLQLAREGYQVWSDVTHLVGGESFWADIEEAIRDHAAKFLFVLTKASNAKQGTLDELHLARTVAKTTDIKDFIIPLKADDIGFDQANVAIHRLNIVDFTAGWGQGLASVLEKLEKDSVPKEISRFNPGVVASWWAAHRHGSRIVREEKEQCLSNWFLINGIPQFLLVHTLAPTEHRIERNGNTLPFPAYPIRDSAVSFAPAEDLRIQVTKTTTVAVSDCLREDSIDVPIGIREARNALTYLLRMAWRNHLVLCGLPRHPMANDRECSFFMAAMFDSKLFSFNIPGCISGRRSLVGQVKNKTWHFAFSADVQLEPILTYVVRPHVLFSDDGLAIWDSSARLHRMRRSACRDWWNQHWRDRLIASMCWIAAKRKENELVIPVSSTLSLHVPVCPVCFESPVAYDDSLVIEDALDEEDVIEQEEAIAEDKEGEA